MYVCKYIFIFLSDLAKQYLTIHIPLSSLLYLFFKTIIYSLIHSVIVFRAVHQFFLHLYDTQLCECTMVYSTINGVIDHLCVCMYVYWGQFFSPSLLQFVSVNSHVYPFLNFFLFSIYLEKIPRSGMGKNMEAYMTSEDIAKFFCISVVLFYVSIISVLECLVL